MLVTVLAVSLLSLFGVVRQAHALSPDVVISQVYGGGGNVGSTYTNDFIELFNRGTAPVSLNGWSVQYTSATGSTWQVTPLSGTIQPGHYYLVSEAAGSGGSQPLPTPEVTAGILMSGTTGKVLLASDLTARTTSCPADAAVLDRIGFGPMANCSETSPTAALTNPTAAIRRFGGCTETDNNLSDFSTGGAPTPRNGASPAHSCVESAPAVSTTTPASGDVNVSVGASITVSFSETVNVSAGAITVECPVGTVVGANPSAVVGVPSVTFTPGAPLPLATACQIRVSAAGVGDTDLEDPPDAMLGDFATGFMTMAAASCTASDTPIGQIQGTGPAAALLGTRTVQGVVVGDYEYPGSGLTGDHLRGFYLQNAAGTDDGNPLTSDGIFIYNASVNSVSLGQVVQVTGNVSEYNFNSTGGTVTEITASNIEVCPSTASITPVSLSLPLASADELERYESMLVTFPQPLFVTEHYFLARFGQVTLSGSDRLPQPTNIVAPGPAALAEQAANDLNRIFLDDELQLQNPDPIRFARNGSPLSASNTLRGGDYVQGLTGVLTQSDATTASNVEAATDPVLYRVRPVNALGASLPSFQAANPRPAVPPVVAGSLKVAGFNLLNYFNTFGDTACSFGVGGGSAECRGANNATEFARQWPKTVAAALGTGAAILVVSEIENDGYGSTSAIQDLVNKLNAATAPGTWAFIDADARTGQLNALGVDAIKVAMLYQSARVAPVGQTSVANTGAFGLYERSGDVPIQRNRPALMQAFQETTGSHGRVVVVGNHLKSKGTPCDDNVSPVGPDEDADDGQGNCNLTRTAAAEDLVDWIASNPTGTGEKRVLVLGDMNAYALEDPIEVLREEGFTDLIEAHIGGQAYSYVFGGQWGYLDHALGTSTLALEVADVKEWHINADEPIGLDYNTEFKSAGQVSSLFQSDAFRASDHDPVIVGLNLTSVAASVPASDATWSVLLALLLLGGGSLSLKLAGTRREEA